MSEWQALFVQLRATQSPPYWRFEGFLRSQTDVDRAVQNIERDIEATKDMVGVLRTTGYRIVDIEDLEDQKLDAVQKPDTQEFIRCSHPKRGDGFCDDVGCLNWLGRKERT
jgi:hypothetical protein